MSDETFPVPLRQPGNARRRSTAFHFVLARYVKLDFVRLDGPSAGRALAGHGLRPPGQPPETVADKLDNERQVQLFVRDYAVFDGLFWQLSPKRRNENANLAQASAFSEFRSSSCIGGAVPMRARSDEPARLRANEHVHVGHGDGSKRRPGRLRRSRRPQSTPRLTTLMPRGYALGRQRGGGSRHDLDRQRPARVYSDQRLLGT
jgi:hypothetical protein